MVSMRSHTSCLLLVAVPLLMTGCGDDRSSTSADAVTTSTVAETQLVTTSLEPAAEFQYGTPDIASDEQAVGFYKAPTWFNVAFTFGTAEAYRGIGEPLTDASIFGIAQGSKSLPQRQLLFWASVRGFSADDFFAELRDTPNLDIGEESTATVAGIDARVVDASASESVGIYALGALVGLPQSWKTNTREVRLRFMVLSFVERTLVIYIEAPTADFDDFILSADKVLATIQFQT
jgi:hypothetical protein